MKPCPFCGEVTVPLVVDSNHGKVARCASCGATGPYRHGMTAHEVAAAWDRRVDASPEDSGTYVTRVEFEAWAHAHPYTTPHALADALEVAAKDANLVIGYEAAFVRALINRLRGRTPRVTPV